jgi:hypothetical protein
MIAYVKRGNYVFFFFRSKRFMHMTTEKASQTFHFIDEFIRNDNSIILKLFVQIPYDTYLLFFIICHKMKFPICNKKPKHRCAKFMLLYNILTPSKTFQFYHTIHGVCSDDGLCAECLLLSNVDRHYAYRKLDKPFFDLGRLVLNEVSAS